MTEQTQPAKHGSRRIHIELPEPVLAAVEWVAPMTVGSVSAYIRRALLNQLDVDRKNGGRHEHGRRAPAWWLDRVPFLCPGDWRGMENRKPLCPGGFIIKRS